MRIRFDKVDGFIRIYDGNRYFTLFNSEKYDAIYNRVRYLIGVKSGIIYVFSYYYAKFKVFSLDFLLIEKNLTLQVIIRFKSVLNKDQNLYYYNIFSEKYIN